MLAVVDLGPGAPIDERIRLAPGPGPPFEHEDAMPEVRQSARGGKSRESSADDNDVHVGLTRTAPAHSRAIAASFSFPERPTR
ncbi:MAG TPA: hypothetical protein VNM91_12675, partial [Dehalococcoidia bacterium]|nr:hypothetical protein [Dehalococcoidia bacterium]